MNKQIVQSSYDRILLHNAKKKITDTWNIMDESQKHYFESKTPEYIPFDSIYLKFKHSHTYLHK